MKKASIVFGALALAVIALVLTTNFHRNLLLSRQENFIMTLELPNTIEIIAVKSAIGDSGGNGNHSTLRSVMLVKTELTRDKLISVFISLGVSLSMYPFTDNINWDYLVISTIAGATGEQFSSPRGFSLDFEDLNGIEDFNGFYFIEFVR